MRFQNFPLPTTTGSCFAFPKTLRQGERLISAVTVTSPESLSASNAGSTNYDETAEPLTCDIVKFGHGDLFPGCCVK